MKKHCHSRKKILVFKIWKKNKTNWLSYHITKLSWNIGSGHLLFLVDNIKFGYVSIIYARQAQRTSRQTFTSLTHRQTTNRNPKRYQTSRERLQPLPLQRHTQHFSRRLSQKYSSSHSGILKFANCSNSIFVLSLIYIDRIQ